MLVHGDYHLNNAIFGPRRHGASILDWELCTVGDPLADVGLMVAYWNELGPPRNSRRRALPRAGHRAARFPGASELALDYARGIRSRPWRARLLGRLRLLEGGDHRGGRLSPLAQRPHERLDAGRLRPAVARLAELALAAVERALGWRSEPARASGVPSPTIAGGHEGARVAGQAKEGRRGRRHRGSPE